MIIQLKDIPIISGVEFDLTEQSCPCGKKDCLEKWTINIRTLTALSPQQREYIVSNKDYVKQQLLLKEFHRSLKLAGYDVDQKL